MSTLDVGCVMGHALIVGTRDSIPVMAGGGRRDGGMFWILGLPETKITWPLPRKAMAALLLALPNKKFGQITSIMIIWFKMLTYGN